MPNFDFDFEGDYKADHDVPEFDFEDDYKADYDVPEFDFEDDYKADYDVPESDYSDENQLEGNLEYEQPEKNKRTFSERRVISLKDKLNALKDKMKKKPPKTIIGKKFAIAKLNRLSNMIDRRILKNNINLLTQQQKYSNYDEYTAIQNSNMEKIADLQLEKEGILRELHNLERIDPNSTNSIFAENKKIIQKNMPKGYTKQQSEKEPRTNLNNSNISRTIQKLTDKLNMIEEQINYGNQLLTDNDKKYSESISNIENNLKKELAVIKPNIFKRIKTFFKNKIDKINESRKQRHDEADNALKNAMNKANDASSNDFLTDLKVKDLTSEEQAKKSQEIQERLNNMQQEGREADKSEPSKEPADD